MFQTFSVDMQVVGISFLCITVSTWSNYSVRYCLRVSKLLHWRVLPRKKRPTTEAQTKLL